MESCGFFNLLIKLVWAAMNAGPLAWTGLDQLNRMEKESMYRGINSVKNLLLTVYDLGDRSS